MKNIIKLSIAALVLIFQCVLILNTSFAQSGPAGYTFCSWEFEYCGFTGTAQVAYGANGAYFYKTLTNGTACSNSVFGDPVSGIRKGCYYKASVTSPTAAPTIAPTSTPVSPAGLSGFSYCARELEQCAFSGTAQVAYGANGAYFYKTLTNGTACSNSVFGDPISGIGKACYYKASVTSPTTAPTIAPTSTPISPAGLSGYTFCSWEFEYCGFTGTAQVAYGANGAYFYKTLTNGTACSNSVFGDPVSGIRKGCYYKASVTSPTAAPTIAPTNTPLPTVAPVTLSVPSIVAPLNGEQIAYDAQPFVFNWDVVSGATNYHLQIATDTAFSQMLYDNTPSSDGWAAQSKLNAGTYYWRVAAMASSAQGPWTSTLRVVIVAPAPTPIAPQEHPLATKVPYTSTSPWNTPISTNPIYDRYSSQMVADMGKGVTGGKIYSDTTQYTYPVYFADKNTPRYTVPCTQYKCTVVDANGTVTRVTSMTMPIPNGAQQSAGTDAQLIVIDTETGTEYGLYHAAKQADGSWAAGNGYTYSINYAGTQPGFGSRGAGVPYYAGLIRPWEIRQGEIKHAIAFVYQFTAATKCVFPAAQTDGTTTSGYPIPEGARIQLNPNLTDADFDRWGLTRAGKIVARAMQKYGMILIDTGGSPKIIAENLTANTLYGESWADADLNYTKNVISSIPYTELRVLDLGNGYYSGQTANYGKCIK